MLEQPTKNTDEALKLRGRAQWLTFEYALAMGSLVTSSTLMVSVFTALFDVWTGSGVSLSTGVSGWLPAILSLDMVTAGTGLVTASVFTVMLAVLSLVLFKRVSAAISSRKGYTGRLVYKVITYGAFMALLVPALVLAAKLVSVVVSSLMFIGIDRASYVYKSLYLAEFLPYLLSLGLLVAIMCFVGKIIQGFNKSKIAAIAILAVSGAALMASIISVAIQAHS